MRIVLGGGIGGLAAAYYLRSKFPNEIIKLYESSSYTGGWIKSTKLSSGVIFEQGPRTLRPKGETGYNTLQLVDEIGLSSKIIPIRSSHPAAKNRMIYAQGKLNNLPSSLPDIFKKNAPFSKPLFSYLVQDLTAAPVQCEDESVYSFVERRFGSDVANYAVSPLICGICAGDAKEISVKFLMKALFEKEQKYGGVVKGYLYEMWENGLPTSYRVPSVLGDVARSEKWSIYSFEGGLETLPKSLTQVLNDKDVEIICDSTCNKLDFINGSVVLSVNGYTQEFIGHHIVSSLPSAKLAELIRHQHPELAENLEKIPSVTVAVVNLHYKDPLDLQNAFGFLVPPSEELPILGVIFDSCCFPNSSGTVLSVMMGGHWFTKNFGNAPDEKYLLNTAIEQLRIILHIKTLPDDYKVNILHECIPQYVVGHYEKVSQIEQYIRDNNLPLSICGSSYHGVGVNDVIFSARKAVDSL